MKSPWSLFQNMEALGTPLKGNKGFPDEAYDPDDVRDP